MSAESSANSTPDEAEPWPPDFPTAVRQAAAAVGWRFQSSDADGLVFTDAGGVPINIGLAHFFLRFRDIAPAEWPARIADYLRTAHSLTSKRADDDDLNAVAEHVLVRLGRPYPRTPPVSVWSRPLPETELGVMLVVAASGGFRFVRDDAIAATGRSEDEWYEIGLENLRRRTPAGALVVLDPETGLLAFNSADNHDGSRALLIDAHLPAPSPHGVLASVPDRNATLVLPLDRRALAPRALALLRVLTTNQHAEATHPISDEVFWVRDGVWRPFGIDVGDGGVSVRPPDEMRELLDELTGGA